MSNSTQKSTNIAQEINNQTETLKNIHCKTSTLDLAKWSPRAVFLPSCCFFSLIQVTDTPCFNKRTSLQTTRRWGFARKMVVGKGISTSSTIITRRQSAMPSAKRWFFRIPTLLAANHSTFYASVPNVSFRSILIIS